MNLLPKLAIAAALAAYVGLPQHLSAQTVLYSYDFEVDSSANWSVFNASGTGTPDYTAQFAFNYLTNKFVRNGVTNTIPLAPSGGGGKGVKLTVNKNDSTADTSAVTIYPLGQSFSGDFALKFDMWINYAGGSQGEGGAGTTEFVNFGIDSTASHANWISTVDTSDGIWFALTGEAGAAGDYRAFIGDNATPVFELKDVNGGFLDRNFDGIIDSADQEVFNEADTNLFKLMFPSPTFETAGMPSKQWAQCEVRQRGNEDGSHTVTWLINGYVIAAHSFGDQIGLSSGDIMLGAMDIFASISNPLQDNFVIFDNVRVVDLTGADPLPIVSVLASDATAAEPGGSTGLGTDNGVFTISRTGSTANPLTVNYRMSTAASASNGVDYVFLNGVATIPAGVSSTNITLTVTNDAKSEATEFAIMTLAGSTNYDIYDNASTTVAIDDDADIPNVSISANPIWSLESNTNRFGQFNVALSTPFTNNIVINYNISGTATNGVNYASIPTSVTIAAGETNAVIKVTPVNDSTVTSNLTVTLTLTTGVNYLLSSSTNSTVTIANNDLAALPSVFSDDFDTDSSANWNVNPSAANCDAAFAFDYSTVGIPPAPHTVGATTRGLRFRANSPVLGAAAFSGISASPKNQNFTGDFRLHFDWWINFPGPFPGGGAGSTQFGMFGISRGTIAQWPGGATTSDAAYIAIDGDGGTTLDYRCYTNAGAPLALSTGVYAAGTAAGGQDAGNIYYSGFGLQAAPDAQLNVAPIQTGLVQSGAIGEAWHDAVMTKHGSVLTWILDGVPIATVDASSLTLSSNIFVGHFDFNTSQTTTDLDNLQFSLVDNLVVEALATAAPNITNTQLINGGTQIQIDFTGSAGSTFTLLRYDTIDGTPSSTTATLSNTGSGTYRFVTDVSGNQGFFRIQAN